MMVPTIKLGVVEDEVVIAMTIVSTLKKLNYNVTKPASNYAQAIEMIEKERPDLLLLDINLGGQKDGIDVAEYVRLHHNLPVIFLTAHSDASTVKRAKLVNPNAYLLKPFTKDDLFAAIEIAIHNFDEKRNKNPLPDQFMVKSGYDHVNLKTANIIFIESKDNYVTIHLASEKQLIVRSTLTEMADRLPTDAFLRINRSVIVHVAFVNKIETEKIFLNEHQFSITPKVKNELLGMMA